MPAARDGLSSVHLVAIGRDPDDPGVDRATSIVFAAAGDDGFTRAREAARLPSLLVCAGGSALFLKRPRYAATVADRRTARLNDP
jgi:hypothetical protein